MGIPFRQPIPFPQPRSLRRAPQSFDYQAHIRLPHGQGVTGVAFGLCNGHGYALTMDTAASCLYFMEIQEGMLLDRGMRRLPVKPGQTCPVRVTYGEGILRLWLNENPLDTEPWPKFEFALDLPGGEIGFFGNGELADESLLAWQPEPVHGETFQNPVRIGADPDILYHDGRYYLYNRIPNDPNSREDAFLYQGGDRAALDHTGDQDGIFRVAWSTDLVHWSDYTVALKRHGVLAGAFCMSPNVFEKDGWFYLLFAAGRLNGEESFHIYYAVSRSPAGPFEMRAARPLHPDVQEIGGMPFVDTDGQVYITYVRFDHGNHIYLQRLTVDNGTLTPQDDTLVHVLSPEMDYEMDEHGRIVEGGVIIPHNGLYYMIYADGHYLGHYGESYAVADNVFGPYRRYAYNPILNHHFQADGTGDGIVIYSPDRSQMMMGYHRHYSPDEVEPRMTCMDPMRFIPDPDGGPDLLAVRGPSVVPQSLPFQQ